MNGDQLEPIRDMDEAVERLTPVIENITRSYRADLREDVRQSCWAKILQLSQNGCDSEKVMTVAAKFAAIDEYNEARSYGLRPLRKQPTDEQEPPQRVFCSWAGNSNDTHDAAWAEPYYEVPENNVDNQRAIIASLRNYAYIEQERDAVRSAMANTEANLHNGNINVTVRYMAAVLGRGFRKTKQLLQTVAARHLENEHGQKQTSPPRTSDTSEDCETE
jgi:hypothetical protein